MNRNGKIMYHAGVRFNIGDLVNIRGKPFFYFGEDEDQYSLFYHMGDFPEIEVLRLTVEFDSPTIIEALRIPRISSIIEALG